MQFKDTSKLEEFLMAEDKTSFFNTLVEGSCEKFLFQLIHSLNTKGRLSEQEIEMINNDHCGFKSRYCTYHKGIYINSLLFKNLLNEFTDKGTSNERRADIITHLKDYYFDSINLYATKPTSLGNTQLQKDTSLDHLSSSLNQSQVEPDYNELNKSEYEIRILDKNVLTKIDILKFEGKPQTKLQLIQEYLKNVGAYCLGDSLIPICQQYVSLYKQLNKDKEYFPSDLYMNFTTEQLLKLREAIPFCREDQICNVQLFEKIFGKALSPYQSKSLPDMTTEEKLSFRKLLVEMMAWIKNTLPVGMYSLYDQFLYQVLMIDLDMERCDKLLFKQFLESPMKYHNTGIYYNKDYREKIVQMKRSYQDIFHSVHHLMVNEWLSEGQIVHKYLTHFFQHQKDYDEFTPYFDVIYLKTIFYKVRLQMGDTFPDVQTVIPAAELEELTKSKEITICNINQLYYKQGDTIILKVDIKNIPNMTIKVFQIDTENYYIKNLSKFDNSINLEGINPLGQQANIQYKLSPIIKKRYEFTFEELSKVERGVFIIEFMGNGISSRAVIRKGGLAFIEKSTLTGHLLTLISEDQEICKPGEEGHTGIWLKGRFIKANEKGQVIIPFDSSESTVPVVLVHNSFADLTNLKIKTENYEFKCAYLYNEECFLRGNKAKIIIQPRLYINNMAANMKILEDMTVTAVLTNELNIPNTYTFKQLQFAHNSDLEIEVPVQNLVQNVSIRVNGRIKKLLGQYQSVSSDHTIYFELYDNSNSFVNLFLKRSANTGYSIFMHGKNGEPYPNQPIRLNFVADYTTKGLSFTLKTDENGQVVLGKLEHISRIQASFSQNLDLNQITREWKISNNTRVTYPSLIKVIEGDSIILPALTTEISKNTYLFGETFGRQVIRDCLGHITYQNNRIVIKGLSQGTYNLLVKSVGHEVQIEVIKGKYWKENNNYIINAIDNSFSELTNSESSNIQILGVTQAAPASKKDNAVDLHVKVMLPLNKDVKGVMDMIRVHVFGLNYCTTDPSQFANNLLAIKCAELYSSLQFGQKKSVFLNNKQLGDEVCYVLDRQNQQKFIGNTLEKPQILLKRTFVRDTEFEKEQLEVDKDYKEGEKYIKEGASYQEKKLMARKPQAGCVQQKNDSMLNFLERAGFVRSNLRVDQEGVAVVADLPAGKYSNVIVVVTNYAASISESFTLDAAPQKMRDLRQKTQLNLSDAYCEKRSAVTLRNGDKCIMKSDAECLIIDNLGQLFDLQKEVRIASGQSDADIESAYLFWDFLKEWPTLSAESKLKKYDEYACHEINLFIHQKDPEFFGKVVKPFIQNKIQKTFVDHYLLDDQDEVESYAQPQNLLKLNCMEQCLLVSSLILRGKHGKAEQVVASIEAQAQVLKIDTNRKKILFDTVISAKIQSSTQSEKMKKAAMAPKIQMAQSEMKAQYLFGSSQPQSRMMPGSMRDAPQMMMMKKEMCYAPQTAMMPMMAKEEELDNEDETICGKKAYDQRYEDMLLDEDVADRMIEQKKQYKPGYQKLKQTKEYVERTYWKMKDPKQSSSLIALNLYWSSLASYLFRNQGKFGGFLTENFIYATSSHSEMICALSFMDLGYNGGAYELNAIEGRLIQIVSMAQSNLLIFQKDIVKSQTEKMGDIAISQRIFDPLDRYTYLEDDISVKIEKNISEYITNKVYGCQVIITNCSIADLELQILTEIPNGAIPIHSNEYTKSHTRYIEHYHTELIEYFFYFPQVGSFRMYPANVSRNESILSTANSLGEIEIKKELAEKKMESFYDILRNGKMEDILKFIAEKNIHNSNIFKFTDIYWLVYDNADFYRKYIQILKKRMIFDNSSWVYSLHHRDVETFIELLNSKQFQENQFNRASQGTQVQYYCKGGINVNALQIYEYYPLLSSRTHNFQNQQKSKILNIQFKQTYEKFLSFLVEVPELEAVHLIVWCYYLILQERIDETIKLFQKIKTKDVQKSCALQYDYLAAYLDVYTGHPDYKVSREIAKKYLDYPVLSWKKLFTDLSNQLREYDGVEVEKHAQVEDAELSKNIKASIGEQTFSFELDQSTIILTYQSTEELEFNYYELDLEILFSRTPFLISSKSTDDFSYVKANLTQKIQLKKSNQLETYKQEIPKELANKNLLIQVKGQNKVLSKNYFSTQIKVQLIENYGQVKVFNQKNQTLSKVYVKVFAKQKNGDEVFYRDGYTDMRGKFDYALSSNNDIDSITKFSILISHAEYGSIIKEVAPPSKLSTMEETINLL